MTPALISSAPARGRLRLVFTQRHTDNSVYGPFVETRPSGEDASAFQAAHGVALLASLVAAETADGVARIRQAGSAAVVPPARFITTTDVEAAAREAYRTAVEVDAIMLGDYLRSLTDARLRVLFAMNQAQVTSLRTTKLTPTQSQATAIRAATGVA